MFPRSVGCRSRIKSAGGKGGFGLRGREFQGCRRKSTRGVDPRSRGASDR